MNIVSKITDKGMYLRQRMYIKKKTKELDFLIKNRTSKNRIYFFCTPSHSNLGDQAQLYCWLRLMKEWYPDYEVVCVPTLYRQFDTIRAIHEGLRKDDIIYIHSGYLIFDPHPELPFILDVIRGFYDHHVVILPQTVNILGGWFQHIVSHVFNDHPNLTLYCRDEVSLEKANHLFPNVTNKLMPDVVTSLIGNETSQFPETRKNGIMFCVRNDGEKFYTDNQITELRMRLESWKTSMCDTTIVAPVWKWDVNREQLIRQILQQFAKYQVVITDRYHGTIFSQIVNTPVIVISSTDHKLSSGMKWFPHEKFSDNISFAKDLNEAYEKAVDILKRNGAVKKNPAWFKENYFSSPF